MIVIDVMDLFFFFVWWEIDNKCYCWVDIVDVVV